MARKQPYTERGIRRLKCYRCKAPASTQWQICADNNVYRPLCEPCDVDLNRTVLVWAGDPEIEQKMEAYSNAR